MTRPAPRITIHTRDGCGLCRRAEEIVAENAGRCRVVVVDIDADPVVQAAYHLRVPVVAIGEVEIHDAGGDEDELRRALRRAARGRFGTWARRS